MLPDDDVKTVQELHHACQSIQTEVAKVLVGQQQVIEDLLTALLSGGHCLLVGVPGLAKTLMIRSLAKALDVKFNRIQFTPDLMPADITGTEVIQEDRSSGQRSYRFLPGPIFANLVLADEINRTPPKTQAALLEAMQEQGVTVGGETHSLPAPFFVLATQNPIDQEGTYPLPEAQLDRFMLQVWVDYPDEDDELEIVKRTTSDAESSITPLLGADQLIRLTSVIRRIPIADHIARYALRLARSSRPQSTDAPDFIKEFTLWGAGPRASQYLVLGAKSRAVIQGRMHVGIDDIRSVAAPVLRHRIKTNFHADAEGITPDELVRRLLAHVSVQADARPAPPDVDRLLRPPTTDAPSPSD